MTDTETIRFSRLNDSNYPEWVVRMEATLVKRGLWPVISITVDPNGKDASTIAAELKKKIDDRDATKMLEARAEMIL